MWGVNLMIDIRGKVDLRGPAPPGFVWETKLKL
jgi:hypothetical protein